MTKNNSEKTVLDTNNSTVDAGLATDYLSTIEAGEEANTANFNFIVTLDERMKQGMTQAIAIATLKETAKGLKVGVIVKHGHVPAVPTAALIIEKFEAELGETSASKILTLASRVLSDVKASGVRKHIAKAETLAELDENTLSKAESQARDKGESTLDEVVAKADAITLESIVDALDAYLNQQDIKSLQTSEIEKLHKVIARLITVEKNSKVA
jgi:ribosomal protein L29